MFKLWSTYDSKDLKIVEDFIVKSTQLHADCLERVKTSVANPQAKRRPPPAPQVRNLKDVKETPYGKRALIVRDAQHEYVFVEVS